MSENPESNDFNRVKARLEAIQATAFINIRCDINSAVEASHASKRELTLRFD